MKAKLLRKASALPIQATIQVEALFVENDDQSEATRIPVRFRGSNILAVCKAIAEKLDAALAGKKYPWMDLDVVSVKLENSGVGSHEFAGSREDGPEFRPAAALIKSIIGDYSKAFRRDKERIFEMLELWGNTYDEGYDADTQEYFETEEHVADKQNASGDTWEQFAANAARAVDTNFGKRENKVQVHFAGVEPESLKEGILKAVIGTKTSWLWF